MSSPSVGEIYSKFENVFRFSCGRGYAPLGLRFNIIVLQFKALVKPCLSFFGMVSWFYMRIFIFGATVLVHYSTVANPVSYAQ